MADPRSTAGIAVALAVAAVLGVVAWSAVTRWHPSIARYPLQGIDVGERPAPIEWGSVRAAGADFAYLVATAGTDRRDPSFEANWQALPEAGLRRGAVHLFSLCRPGRAQADAFNTTVPEAMDALPAAVDVTFAADCADRPAKAAVEAEMRAFVEAVEAHTGKPVVLRVSRAVEGRYQLTAAIDRPAWVIGFGIVPSYAARPWRLWRATGVRRVDGVEGNVNWDVVAP